jgi:hypothetical protein
MLRSLKYKLFFWLTKGLLPTVEVNYVLRFDKIGNIFLGDLKLTKQEIMILKREADVLDELMLWKYIVNTLNDKVSKRVFEASQSFEDLVIGKSILYTLKVQQEIKDKLKNIK